MVKVRTNIYFNKEYQKWHARLRHNGKYYSIGKYPTKPEAEAACAKVQANHLEFLSNYTGNSATQAEEAAKYSYAWYMQQAANTKLKLGNGVVMPKAKPDCFMAYEQRA